MTTPQKTKKSQQTIVTYCQIDPLTEVKSYKSMVCKRLPQDKIIKMLEQEYKIKPEQIISMENTAYGYGPSANTSYYNMKLLNNE